MRCAGARSDVPIREPPPRARTVKTPWLLLGAAVAGCVKAPPNAPEPLSVHSARTPGEIVPAAVSVLANAGFQVTAADVRTATVEGIRTGSPRELEGIVQCPFTAGSIAAREALTTLTLRVTAAPSDSGGSNVNIAGTVKTDLSRVPGQSADSTSFSAECRSSGAIERRIAESLRH